MITTNLIKSGVNHLDYLAIENFEPVFINNYSREYYIDFSGEIRLTIDRKQKFYSVSPLICKSINSDEIIIELKFNSKIEYNNFVIKTNLVQNSKFSNGVNACILRGN